MLVKMIERGTPKFCPSVKAKKKTALNCQNQLFFRTLDIDERLAANRECLFKENAQSR